MCVTILLEGLTRAHHIEKIINLFLNQEFSFIVLDRSSLAGKVVIDTHDCD